jgi:ribosomal protein S1
MSDSDKPETPSPVEAPAPPPAAAEAKPETKPEGPPARTGRPGKPGKGPSQSFGSPRRRTLDPIPSLEHFGKSSPKLKDLDDEIAAELEAALSGFSEKEKDLLTEERRPAKAPDGPQASQRKIAKVHSIHGPDVFVDLPGGRGQGVLAMEQFTEGPPKPGQSVEVEIDGYDAANGLILCSRRGSSVVADWSSVAPGMIVEARVLESNKGGLAVDINGIRGFMPISQIDLYRVEQTEQFINQKLKCMVIEVSPEERNLVVSRRSLLEKEREEQKEKTWAELQENQVREGIVRSVRDFGAFVDLGGVDGLLHVSEMSWTRVSDPTQIVQPGQSVKVVVLKIDREKRKISLGLKQLQASPWDAIGEKYHSMQVLAGKVTRTMDFGAFVELEPGVEGLIHISELARQRVWRVTDIVKPGQEVQVKIMSIDPEQRRISLSLKEAIPVEPPKAEEEEEEEAAPSKPVKPRTTPLRGGIGEQQWLQMPEQE